MLHFHYNSTQNPEFFSIYKVGCIVLTFCWSWLHFAAVNWKLRIFCQWENPIHPQPRSVSTLRIFRKQSKVISAAFNIRAFIPVCVEVAGIKVRRKSRHHPSRFTAAGALVINGPRRTHSSIFYIWEPCSLITRVTYSTNTMLTNVRFIAKGHSAWEQFATHIKFILCLRSRNSLQVHR